MKTHYLKIEEKWFERLREGVKTCEIRFNDRDFQAGERIIFEMLNIPLDDEPYQITHVLNFPEGLKEGYVALSLKPLSK